ncbi:MAG: hypothetical protein LUC16_00620 [Coprobacillus sp.]|nr:hypothetical protein [Coprobacillus sp.]
MDDDDTKVSLIDTDSYEEELEIFSIYEEIVDDEDPFVEDEEEAYLFEEDSDIDTDI